MVTAVLKARNRSQLHEIYDMMCPKKSALPSEGPITKSNLIFLSYYLPVLALINK